MSNHSYPRQYFGGGGVAVTMIRGNLCLGAIGSHALAQRITVFSLQIAVETGWVFFLLLLLVFSCFLCNVWSISTTLVGIHCHNQFRLRKNFLL